MNTISQILNSTCILASSLTCKYLDCNYFSKSILIFFYGIYNHDTILQFMHSQEIKKKIDCISVFCIYYLHFHWLLFCHTFLASFPISIDYIFSYLSWPNTSNWRKLYFSVEDQNKYLYSCLKSGDNIDLFITPVQYSLQPIFQNQLPIILQI